MPDGFQVYAETTDSGSKIRYSSDDIPVTPDSDGRVFVSITDRSSLEAYRKYNTMIAAKNSFGESNSTGEIPFSKPVSKSLKESGNFVTFTSFGRLAQNVTKYASKGGLCSLV